ncbi:hypothetical protein OG21DRAFT_1480825 [Imleria badia]|nr:hypothetical protein OG21DRAFT_1480825 [Imleria badia]
MYGKRKNHKVTLLSKEIEYITINDLQRKALYHGREKIPMQVFHDAYFDDVFNCRLACDVLDIMEQRHVWARMVFTPSSSIPSSHSFLPQLAVHAQSQDEEQVRDHCDRGDDFYEWFLGPRMVYTSGVVTT